jgi:hypothetical protein
MISAPMCIQSIPAMRRKYMPTFWTDFMLECIPGSISNGLFIQTMNTAFLHMLLLCFQWDYTQKA